MSVFYGDIDVNNMEPPQIMTSHTCPLCGFSLEMLEDDELVWFGCGRCLKYVTAKKRDLVAKFFDYRHKRLMWSTMLEELYSSYTSKFRQL